MKGIAAAPGMALAAAYIIREPEIDVRKYGITDAAGELARFREAVSGCHALTERLIENMNGQDTEIMDFQLLLLEDTSFIGKIEQIISEQGFNCEYAVKEVSDEYILYLEGLKDNDYLRERAADVSDLSQRLLAVLTGVGRDMPELAGEYIAIGDDIAPSCMASLDKNKLKGIILEKGGMTSHTVILSRSLGIPCLIETAGILEAAEAGAPVLLDAVSGEAVINPDETRIADYEKYISDAAVEKASLRPYIKRETITLDGARMKVYANITTKDEAEEVVRRGGEGVGLFRSELLYMSQTGAPPSEETQYREYAGAAAALQGRPLVIRTLDIGGDKRIGYMDIGKEDNPFLGYRAIRFCLERPDIFKPQIAAIMRAGVEGNVWMMFPMITNLTEIRRAKQVVSEVKEELAARGAAFNPNIKTGIMVETPAAAIDARFLAKEVSFFSIGTNDLAQYLFAADRANAKVAELNSHFQPALLRAIHSIVTAAHEAGIEVDICGQAGENDLLIPLWTAMGVDNLSVSIPRITVVRKRICNNRKSECLGLLETVLRLADAGEVEAVLRKFNEIGVYEQIV